MTALAYTARDGAVIRIGFGPIPDQPISLAVAIATRSRMIRRANALADRGEFITAATAQDVAHEIEAALAGAAAQKLEEA